MSTPSTATEEPAEVIPGGLDFVWTTLSTPPGEDEDNDLVHDSGVRV